MSDGCLRWVMAVACDRLANELPPEECSRFDDHLCCCDICRGFFQSYTVMVQMTRALPAGPLPERLRDRVREAMARGDGPGSAPPDVV
jgi:hypothetical protein